MHFLEFNLCGVLGFVCQRLFIPAVSLLFPSIILNINEMELFPVFIAVCISSVACFLSHHSVDLQVFYLRYRAPHLLTFNQCYRYFPICHVFLIILSYFRHSEVLLFLNNQVLPHFSF